MCPHRSCPQPRQKHTGIGSRTLHRQHRCLDPKPAPQYLRVKTWLSEFRHNSRKYVPNNVPWVCQDFDMRNSLLGCTEWVTCYAHRFSNQSPEPSPQNHPTDALEHAHVATVASHPTRTQSALDSNHAPLPPMPQSPPLVTRGLIHPTPDAQ
jgi:hypothetical protein